MTEVLDRRPTAAAGSAADWRDVLIVASLTALAAYARLRGIGAPPLWLDEAYSVWFSDQSWRYLWTTAAAIENHPSAYYSLLKLWRAFGDDEATLRGLSTALNLAAAPAIYVGGRLIGDRAGGPAEGRLVGACALALFAGASLQIDYAQETRAYAGWTAAMATALAGALWLLTRPQDAPAGLWRDGRPHPGGVAACAALAVGLASLAWLHNLGLIPAAAIGLGLAAWWIGPRRGEAGAFALLAVAALAALALYSPNLATLLRQTAAVSGAFWLSEPTATRIITASASIFGQRAAALPVWALAGMQALVVGLAAAGLVGLWRAVGPRRGGGGAAFWFLLGVIAGPWLATLAISYLGRPIFLSRTLVYLQTPWILLLAAAPLAATGRARAAAIAAVVAVAAGGVIDRHLGDPRAERIWRAAAQLIAESDGAAARVLAAPNEIALPLAYYARRGPTPFAIDPVPAPFPAIGLAAPYPTGNRGAPAITREAAEAAVARHADADRLWYAEGSMWAFDPEGLLDAALDRRFACRRTVLSHGNSRLVELRRVGPCAVTSGPSAPVLARR